MSDLSQLEFDTFANFQMFYITGRKAVRQLVSQGMDVNTATNKWAATYTQNDDWVATPCKGLYQTAFQTIKVTDNMVDAAREINEFTRCQLKFSPLLNNNN
mmetsp:Transcript_43533/g.60425  ORF Transcript_43533/g.60425 Transcript_43533/m.60425 type:complete len:101 (+) Transcript_43533:66-368(+)